MPRIRKKTTARRRQERLQPNEDRLRNIIYRLFDEIEREAEQKRKLALATPRYDVTFTYKKLLNGPKFKEIRVHEKVHAGVISIKLKGDPESPENRRKINNEIRAEAQIEANRFSSGGTSEDLDVSAYNVELVKVTPQRIEEIKTGDMKRLPMKLSLIEFDGLKSPLKTKQDGMCVIRALSQYGYTESYLKQWFTKQCLQDISTGISTDDLESFCKEHDINMIALDLMYDKITRHSCDDKKHRRSLIFVVANEHIYEVEDKKLRKALYQGERQRGFVLTNEELHEIKEDKRQVKECPLKQIVSEPDDGGEVTTSEVIDLDKLEPNTIYYHPETNADLTPVFLDYFRQHKKMPKHRVQGQQITRIDFPSADDKPTGTTTIISHPQIKQALELCEANKIKFQGQGLSRLIEDPEAPKLLPLYGSMNEQLTEIFSSDYIRSPPFIHTFVDASQQQIDSWTKSAQLWSGDIEKCFASIAKEWELPVPDLLCEVVNCNVSDCKSEMDYDDHGLYLVETEQGFPMWGNGFYYGAMLTYCQEQKFEFKTVGPKVVFRRTTNILEEYVDYCFDKHPKTAKHMVNINIGLMGRMSQKRKKSIYCTTPKEASYYATKMNGKCRTLIQGEDLNKLTKEYEEQKRTIDSENVTDDLLARAKFDSGAKLDPARSVDARRTVDRQSFMVRKTSLYRIDSEETVISRTTAKPAFIFIYQMCAVELHKLYTRCMVEMPKAIPLQIKVDAVHLRLPRTKKERTKPWKIEKNPKGPNGKPLKPIARLGRYRKEKTPSKPLTKSEGMLIRTGLPKIGEPLTWSEKTWEKWDNDISSGKRFFEEFPNGCFINEPGGYGKTELMKWFMLHLDEQEIPYQSLSYTNLVSKNLEGQTFHRFFRIGIDGEMRGSQKRRPPIIIIDEHSMVDEFLFSHLVQFKSYGCKIYLVGHFSQHKPIAGNSRGIREARFLKELVHGQRLRLTHCYRTNQDHAKNLSRGSDEGEFPGVYDFKDWKQMKHTGDLNKLNVCYYRNNWYKKNGDLYWESNLNRINKLMVAKYGFGTKGSRMTLRENQYKDGRSKNALWEVERAVASESVDEKEEPDRSAILKSVFTEEKTIIPPAEWEKFKSKCEPGYAVTGHVVQGQTIAENYTIWDWYCRPSNPEDRIDHRYVAMSRSKGPEQITIGDFNTANLQYVYKIRHKHGFVYVGSTGMGRQRYENHWENAMSGSKDCPKLYGLMRHYPKKEDWTFEILFMGELRGRQLLKMETMMIYTHGGLGDMGLNMREASSC